MEMVATTDTMTMTCTDLGGHCHARMVTGTAGTALTMWSTGATPMFGPNTTQVMDVKNIIGIRDRTVAHFRLVITMAVGLHHNTILALHCVENKVHNV